ncbi:MAG: hypothetical protein ACK55I_41350, partial [bacterium]
GGLGVGRRRQRWQTAAQPGLLGLDLRGEAAHRGEQLTPQAMVFPQEHRHTEHQHRRSSGEQHLPQRRQVVIREQGDDTDPELVAIGGHRQPDPPRERHRLQRAAVACPA